MRTLKTSSPTGGPAEGLVYGLVNLVQPACDCSRRYREKSIIWRAGKTERKQQLQQQKSREQIVEQSGQKVRNKPESNFWQVALAGKRRKDLELQQDGVLSKMIRCGSKLSIMGGWGGFFCAFKPSGVDWNLGWWDRVVLIWANSTVVGYRSVILDLFFFFVSSL